MEGSTTDRSSMLQQANFYDLDLVGRSGSIAERSLVRTRYAPFEQAVGPPRHPDYLELVDEYNRRTARSPARRAGLSAVLLFATAAEPMAATGPRPNVIIEAAGSVTEWTEVAASTATSNDGRGNTVGPCFVADGGARRRVRPPLPPDEEAYETDGASNRPVFACPEDGQRRVH